MTIGAVAPELDAAFFRALLRDSDQPRCSDLETGKSGQYTNDDGAGCDGAGRKAGVGASETSPGTAAGDEQLGMAIHPPAEIRAKVNRALASFETVEQYDAKIETAFAVNPATGEVALKKVGTEREVRFTPDEARELAGTVFTHNHPATGGSFSAPDIAMFLAHEMVEMRAFGRGYDGKLYHYRVTRHGRPATQAWQEWVARGMEMSNELHSVWFPEVMSGKRTKEDAELNHNHKVWEDFFADKPGFEYERRVVGEGKRRSLRRATDESRDLAPGEQPDGGWILDGPGSEPDYSAPARARRSDQPRCSELEEGKPGRFTNADGDGCDGPSSDPVDKGAATGRGKLSIRYGNKANAAQKKAAEQAVAAALKGNKLTEDDIVDLFVPEGVEAKLSAPFGGGLSVWLKGDGFEAIRFIKRDLAEETLAIQNEALIFEPRAQGKGMGTAMLAREVRAAARLGVTEILLNAGRNAKAGYFGYKVWPRLGFDAPIPDRYQGPLTAATGKDWSGKNLSDLMADPDGREAWDVHGDSVVLTFDPRPGSKSRRLFDAYLRERAKRKAKRARLDAWLRGDDQPRCSDLEEGKPGRFTNEDGQGCDGAAGEREWVSEQDDIGYAEDPAAIREALDHYGAKPLKVAGVEIPGVYVTEASVIEWDGKESYPSVTDKAEWVVDADVERFLPDYEENWSRDFWSSPGELYHATTEENAASIREEGIAPKSDSRGISNRSVGAAVFTSSDPNELVNGDYGDHVFAIDAAAMKRDGLTPFVSQEPDLADAEMRSALAWAVGLRDYEPEVEQGMSPGTVIVHGAIPPEYLRELTLDDLMDLARAWGGWRRDQPRCSEIEEGKPGRFTNEDGQGCDGAESSKGAEAKADALPEVRFRTNVTPREFIDARNATTRPGFLSPLTEAELDGKTLVLSHDGKVGYMLAPDGYAGNLFNNGGPKGAGKAAMIDAIGRGAKYLDCFDGFLPDLYYDYGFVETGRLKFVDEYAPTGWDFGRYGRPDVVFMAYRGGDRKTIGERVGTFGEHRKAEAYTDDYDAALDRAREVSEGADGEERRGVGRAAQGAARRAGRLHRQPVVRDDQPRCSDLEEGKPGRFTNEDGAGCDGAEIKRPKEGEVDVDGIDRWGVAEATDAHGKVEYELGEMERLRKLGVKLSDVNALVPPGAEGTISNPYPDSVKPQPIFALQLRGEGWFAARRIQLTATDHNGTWPGWIENEVFNIRDASKQKGGLATELLRRQIEFANTYGLKKIKAYAAKGNGIVGYKVWPALGFDASIEGDKSLQAKIARRLPAAKGVSTLLGLYATPGGREFWAEHGEPIEVTFYPRAGSASRRVFDAYLEKRRARDAKRARVAAWLRDQPRCSDLIEGESGKYTNESGDGCDGAAGKKDPVKDHAVKGKGKIAFVDEMGGTAEAADAMLKQFGITPDDIVDLFGPEGSEVTYGIDVATKDPEGRGGALWIKTTLDDGERKMEAWRRIDKPSRKELVLTNLDFHVEPRGSGFGTRFIAREVAAAERLGIKRIVIDTAAGGPNSTAYNGYYTWPLLGFDVPVKRLHTQLAFSELRERWPDAEYLSDIMKTPEGRKFWKEKGAGIFGMEFDVTPGSRSRRVLDAYLERKFGSDTKRAKVEAWLRSDQPRCSELEEGESGKFTNEDGQGCEGAEGDGDAPMGGRKSTREPGDDSTTEYEAHKQGWRETTLADGTVVKTYIPDVDKLEPVEGEGKYTDRVQVDDAAARALKAERERLLAGDSDEQRAAAEKLAAEEQKLRELQEQFDEHQKRDMELYNELDDELRPEWKADQALADAIDTKLADGQEITPEEKAFRAAFEKDSLYSRIRAHERMAPLVEERSQWYNTLSDQRDAIRAAKQELVAADRQSLFLPEDERFDLVVSVADPAATAAGFRDPAAAMLWNDRLAEAKGFLSGVIHKDALTRTSDDATKPVAVSLKPENDFIPYRAYAFPGARNEVVLSADTNAAVMVHELGHLVESGLGSTSRFAPAVMEFLNSRLSDAERDAPFSKLISYHPDSAGYGMGVFRDHLDNLGMVVGNAPSDGWYAGSTHGMNLIDAAAGKMYPPKNFRELYETQKKSYFSVSNNTEVVSMGFEALFRNPRRFAKLDPDYFDFILGLARGYTKSAGRWGQPRKPSRKKRKPKK